MDARLLEPKERSDEFRQLAPINGVDEAGEPAATRLPQFVPFATNGDGGYLFVDVRHGDKTGCVRFWDNMDRDGAALWDSIDVMVDGIADVLINDADLFDEFAVVDDRGSLGLERQRLPIPCRHGTDLDRQLVHWTQTKTDFEAPSETRRRRDYF